MNPSIDRTRTSKIGLFFKRPIPGEVKTRLTPEVSEARAAFLYEAFLLDTIDLCRSVAGAETVLFDGSPTLAPWENLPRDLPLVPQSGPDLGRRMSRALEVLFENGARKALLLGSDSPSLPPDAIRDAFDRLDRCDLVLGPVPDGGYYMIGVKKAPVTLLEEIHWSTGAVLRETVERAGALGMTTDLTQEWFDVDTFDDLERLRLNLVRTERSPRTREALEIIRPGSA